MSNQIEQTTFPARTYLVWRKEINTADVSDKEMWQKAFGAVHSYAQSQGIKIAGLGAAIYFTWDEPKGRADMAIGHPVEGVTEVSHPELSLVEIPESPAYKLTVNGAYEQLMESHGVINKYVQEQGVRSTITVEEYVVTGMDNQNPEEWKTDLYYLYN